jgi:hypothetical protein
MRAMEKVGEALRRFSRSPHLSARAREGYFLFAITELGRGSCACRWAAVAAAAPRRGTRAPHDGAERISPHVLTLKIED